MTLPMPPSKSPEVIRDDNDRTITRSGEVDTVCYHDYRSDWPLIGVPTPGEPDRCTICGRPKT